MKPEKLKQFEEWWNENKPSGYDVEIDGWLRDYCEAAFCDGWEAGMRHQWWLDSR